MTVKPKKNEKYRKEIEKNIQDILDRNYTDLGNGTTQFKVVNALGDIIDYCQRFQDRFGYFISK